MIQGFISSSTFPTNLGDHQVEAVPDSLKTINSKSVSVDSKTETEVFKEKRNKESATKMPSLNTLLPNFCKEKN